MPPFTTYLGNKVLDLLFGKQTFTPASTLYIGLCTGCTDAGVITGEPVGNNYSRKSIVNSDLSTIWAAASSKQKTNSATITFATPSATWGTLTTVFMSDDPTAGNIWSYATLGSAVTPTAGNPPDIPIGQLIISLS